jgi:hypothetical protein
VRPSNPATASPLLDTNEVFENFQASHLPTLENGRSIWTEKKASCDMQQNVIALPLLGRLPDELFYLESSYLLATQVFGFSENVVVRDMQQEFAVILHWIFLTRLNGELPICSVHQT